MTGGGIKNFVQRVQRWQIGKVSWLRWLRWFLLLAAVAVALLIILARQEVHGRVTDQTAQEFTADTTTAATALTNEIQAYSNVLYGFRGLYSAESSLDAASLARYQQTLGITLNYPGLGPVSYVANQSTAGKQIYVVKYVAGGQASNVNLATDATQRQALEQARDTGVATASAPLANQHSFSLIVPVYQTSAVPETVGARQSQLVGFMMTEISYSSLFTNVFGTATNNGITYKIFDAGNKSTPIYTQNLLVNNANQVYSLQRSLQVAGRSWQFGAAAGGNFGTSQPKHTLSGSLTVTGVLLVLLLLGCLLLESISRRQTSELTSGMTADLSQQRSKALAQQTKDEAILSSIADGVFALDMDGKIILFNKAAATISGRHAGEVIGHHYAEMLQFVREDGQPNSHFIERALSGQGSSVASKMQLVKSAGKQVPIVSSAAPIIDDTGARLGAIVVFHDVTHEHELEQAKTEFVSLVSHQLRAPLTAMRLFIEMLLDEQVGQLNPKQRDYLVKVEISTARMIDLVSDFLNTSRIELNRLKVEPRLLQIEDLVADSIDALKPLATQKQLQLEFNKPKLPPVSIEANLYNQIVNNLLSNAIRYTPSGGKVTVSLSRTDEGYLLDVADTGIGIPKAAQKKLFQRFYRADNAKRIESEGSGLGLFLIKRILELSHGRIWYDTAEGEGTTFHVIIPLSGMAPKEGADRVE